jgi:hypothetical protein
MIRRFCAMLVLVAALGAGCGKQSDAERAAFNEPLGGVAAGAPTTVGVIDDAIHKDFSAYKPAAAAGGGGSAAATETAKGGGAEADSVRKAAQAPVDALVAFDPSALMDSFVKEQVAVLRKDRFESELQNTMAALQSLTNVTKSKAPNVPTFVERIKQLRDPFAEALKVEIQDASHAIVKVDGAKAGEAVGAWYQQAIAAIAATAPPAAPEPEGEQRSGSTDRMVERSGFLPEGNVEDAAKSPSRPRPAAPSPAALSASLPTPDQVRQGVAQVLDN